MYRFIIGLAGSTLIFAAASAHLWKQERAAREQSAALELRIQELEGSRAEAPTASTAASATISPVPTQPGTAAPPEPRRAPGGGGAQFGVVSNVGPALAFAASPLMQGGRDKLMEDPEYRDAMRAQQRMFISSRYPDLAQALHLQPDEVDKLMDLLADQQVAMMNRRPPFINGAPDENDLKDWRRQAEQQQRDEQAQIAALLGESKLQEWKEYQETLGARMQVRQLSSVLDGSAEPIRADQMQPLIAAVAEEQRRRTTELQHNSPFQGTARMATAADQLAMMERSVEQTVQHNQRMHDAVAPYLSARQLERFDQMQNQQVQMQRINLRMMRARAAAEARGEIPSADPAMIQFLPPGEVAISSSAVIQSR